MRGGCRHFLFSSVRVGQVVLSLVLGSQGAPVERSQNMHIVRLSINRRRMSLHIKEELPSLLFISLHPRPRLRIVHINKGHLRPTIGAQYTTIQGVISAMHQGCSTKTAGEIQ